MISFRHETYLLSRDCKFQAAAGMKDDEVPYWQLKKSREGWKLHALFEDIFDLERRASSGVAFFSYIMPAVIDAR